MSLLSQIKAHQLNARKIGNAIASNLFTTLIGEAAIIGKNAGNRETTDTEVVAVIKKFIKNIDETVNALQSRQQNCDQFIQEKTLLSEFLPVQLTETELTVIAMDHKEQGMPKFMKYLKDNHAGQYDGKLASTIAKGIF